MNELERWSRLPEAGVQGVVRPNDGILISEYPNSGSISTEPLGMKLDY